MSAILELADADPSLQQLATAEQECLISPYRTFRNRLRTKSGDIKALSEQIDILENDQLIQDYYNGLRKRRGNNGILSENTRQGMRNAISQFARYTNLPIKNDSYTKLARFKQKNPDGRFVNEKPIKTHTVSSSYILGIFRSNGTPLKTKVYNHLDPAEESCSFGIFLEILTKLDEETLDMIQWGLYVPERKTDAYTVPLENIDLSRNDYAVVSIEKLAIKSRTKHQLFSR